MKLLVVEDDPALQATLERTLARRGFTVAAVGDGTVALQRWAATPPDAVVLDLSLPGLDGLQVLAQARAQGLGAPVLILTARGAVGDRVLGLNAGADDYLAKPFDLDELEARLRALVRRSSPAMVGADVRFGRLRHDRAGGAVYLDDAPMELPPRELALLCALLARPGHAVTKERLFEQVFPGEAEVRYEAIEVVAYRLRRKLVSTGVELVTLRGLGYLLRAVA
jgi:two-component system response regulator TctD